MKRPPRTVKIVGKPYTLTANPRLIPDDEETGTCVAAQGQIEYDPDQSPDNLRDTALHEVMHGVWSEMGLGEHFDSKQEEIAVRCLSTGLLDVLRRNKSFARFLLDGA